TAYVFLQWRKLDKALNVLRWFAVFEFLMQTTATVLAFYNILNTPLLYLYVPVDFLLKSFFYARLLSNSINTRIIYLFMVGFILYCLTDVLFISDLHVFNSVALSIQSILMVILTLSTFFIMVESEFMENNPKLANAVIWINSGFFLYHTGNILFFYFGDILMDTTFPDHEALITTVSHSFLYLVMYFCLLIGLWKSPKHTNFLST
ncbi:MAG TPA: hypothetical protein DCG19_00680, partial [Cryomorphaceae bacterium]|nr:hypothetical protein [Cryomorphaceae bacterium]